VTISDQLAILKSLAVVDAVLSELQTELDAERGELNSKKSQLQGLETRIQRGKQNIEEMERTRNDLMLELRQMSVQVAKSREKLSRCRTEREANAAQREVEELRKLFRDREVEIEKLNTLVEQARSDLEVTLSERDQLREELGESEGAVQTKLKDLEERSAKQEAEKGALVKGVKPQVFRRYEMIRKRRGSAVSAAVDSSCSECHIALPPMLYQQIMQAQEMIQCPSCNRILYYEEPELASSDGSTADSQPG
jgi:predicted  nucleic acid-binding Zn-ribbon protein